MALNITLAPEYGYCVAAFFATMLCNFFKVVTVVRARKEYDVQYPNLYAPAGHKYKKEFDCAQRQHQQFLENVFLVTACMFINGLYYPTLAACFHMLFVIGHVVYTIGYNTGNPKNRMAGGLIGHLGDMPQMILTGYVAYLMIKQI